MTLKILSLNCNSMKQGTIPRETNFAWLAGIIDGEGTIGAYFYHEHGYNSCRYGIWIPNTDKRMIDKSAEIMTALGCKVYITEKKYKPGNLMPRYIVFELKIQRRNDVKLILEKTEPYLISKKEQAQVLLKFLNDFPNLLLGRGNKSGKKNEHFDEYDKVQKKLKELKRSYLVPVTTKREAPVNQGEAIV